MPMSNTAAKALVKFRRWVTGDGYWIYTLDDLKRGDGYANANGCIYRPLPNAPYCMDCPYIGPDERHQVLQFMQELADSDIKRRRSRC